MKSDETTKSAGYAAVFGFNLRQKTKNLKPLASYNKVFYNSRGEIGEYVNKQLNKRGIFQLWLIQLTVVFFISSLCAMAVDANAALSALLGGLVYFIPNLCFAIKVFQYQGARSAKQIVNSFYKGEAYKIILSVFLFAAVFIFQKITAPAFFASYIVLLITHWFTPWILVNNLNRLKRK